MYVKNSILVNMNKLTNYKFYADVRNTSHKFFTMDVLTILEHEISNADKMFVLNWIDRYLNRQTHQNTFNNPFIIPDRINSQVRKFNRRL